VRFVGQACDGQTRRSTATMKHWMVLALGNGMLVAVDEVVDGKRGSGGGHRLEADGR
jgi:hypothetical protein